MLSLCRGGATASAAALLLAVSAASAAAAPPLPTDGRGTCNQMFCTMVAEDPGAAAKPVSAPAAPRARVASSGGGGGGSAGWKPLTQEQLMKASAWDYHVNSLCSNAQAAGTAMPAECLPTPAAPAAAAGAPASPTFQPGDATRAAMSRLHPVPPTMGTAPCPSTEVGCKGAVGVPVWLWTTQPWQEQTATATAGPYTVTAVARPTAVTWELGDGQVITCETPGTPYNVSLGFRDSPDCGTRYERVGRYEITATMTYAVTWSGADTGSATIQTAASRTPVDIGEYQVVIDSNG